MKTTIHYVGVGGHTQTITGHRIRLGDGVERGKRGWLWHFCFGFVSGFPVSAIFYYLVTRHTTGSMQHWYWKRESSEFTARTGQSWSVCSDNKCTKNHEVMK